MLSFHNDPKIKQKVLEQLKAHYKADEIIKGVYWQEGKGKGCAVGCTVHSRNHSDYEDILGIPKILAYLEEGIFRDIDNKSAKEFPIQFIEAISVGVDLSRIYNKWAARMLKRVRVYASDDGRIATDKIIELMERKERVSEDEWKEANATARANIRANNHAYARSSVSDVIYAASYAVNATTINAGNAYAGIAYDADEIIKQRDDLLELLRGGG